ncbi:hypothetical protein G7Y89_g468 [Cudoniella acicularis]|uniref:BTB domain-containing protein n=1 Tax=Cudoniella acicularis TaxID=354080 RepID=A0A8H4RY40_9HELO|nr:hypothetical protein G7Y89_g468 [Cudoniella acicularis]
MGAHHPECQVHLESIKRYKNHASKAAKLISHSSQIVNLLVGGQGDASKATQLTCHKTLLSYSSEFFRGALYDKFKESKTDTATLPDDSPEDIMAFIK